MEATLFFPSPLLRRRVLTAHPAIFPPRKRGAVRAFLSPPSRHPHRPNQEENGRAIGEEGWSRHSRLESLPSHNVPISEGIQWLHPQLEQWNSDGGRGALLFTHVWPGG